MKSILGIETSCDECSASVVEVTPHPSGESQGLTLKVRSVATFSQVDLHQPYGGVVPEIASRNHLESINPMIDRALQEAQMDLQDLSAIGVTNRPGLVGSLLVGVSAAKALSYAKKIPLLAIHHLEGHIASLFLDQENLKITYPLLVAVVSGGHTNLYVLKKPLLELSDSWTKEALVGKSRDDAAGEAFDKTAKILGLPYPGGLWIDRESEGGDPNRFDLPRALPQKAILDFSFSGLKTAVAQLVSKMSEKELESERAHLCASIQEAIVDALTKKIKLAVDRYQCQSLAVVGGVAANRRLRSKLHSLQTPVFFPRSEYCTDNAAMIGAATAFRFHQGKTLNEASLLKLNAIANPTE